MDRECNIGVSTRISRASVKRSRITESNAVGLNRGFLIEATEFLKNLVFGKGYLKVTIREGVAATKCHGLKMPAADGKMRVTDTATALLDLYISL